MHLTMAAAADNRGYEKTDGVIDGFGLVCDRGLRSVKRACCNSPRALRACPLVGSRTFKTSDGLRRSTIGKSGDSSGLLRSHTCFNRLDLPPYEDYESSEKKIAFCYRVRFLPLLACSCQLGMTQTEGFRFVS